MYIEFKTKRLKKQCEDVREREKSWPEAVGKKLVQRLNEIAAAPTLQSFCTLKSAECHQLKGNRKGQFAAKLTGNVRLIFEPVLEDGVTGAGDAIDRSQAARIRVLEVEDYH